MITQQDIIFISSIDWGFLWQGHQEIASRFARAGNRVLYVENTGVRSPGLADVGRISERLRKWARALLSGGVREVAPNIYVCSPLVLPPFGSRWQRLLNRRILLLMVRRAARRLGLRDPLLWTFLPTDTALDLIQLVRTPRSVVVYYCAADFEQLTPRRRELQQSEKALIEASDVVFAQEPELAARAARWNENVHVFPCGVNLDAFPLNGHANVDGSAETSDDASGVQLLQSLPRPVIGYVGGLHRHVDYGMLSEMAHACPQWSWVFIGAIQTSVAGLAALPNVYLLGQQRHDSLVRYIRQFDVCIVPYINSHFTATVVPTKINEYLAVGKPVVSTELPAVRTFNAQHDIIQTSAEPKDFLRAIERALELGTDEAAIARGRKVAELGNWDFRLEAMSQFVETKLSARQNPYESG
jgi:glycosyltransferase involved in cell wall biosynthesis